MAIQINTNAICPNNEITIQKLEVSMTGIILPVDANEKVVVSHSKDEVAKCTRLSDNKFHISLNVTAIKSMLEKSWLNGKVEYDIFEAGFILHELCHIKYTDFTSPITRGSQLVFIVRNILEDSRIEYRMSYEFPETSIFFNMLLSAMESAFESKDQYYDEETVMRTSELISHVFNFARYNVVKKTKDISFVSSIIPLILFARRGSSKDCDIATEVIAKMIEKEVNDNLDLTSLPEMKQTYSPITEHLKEHKKKEVSEQTKQMFDNFFDEEQVKSQLENNFNGNKAGTSGLIKNDKRTSFFLEVANQHQKEINNLRSVFVNAFTESKNILSKDGDLNFKKQQEAYLNSITGDEGKDYQYRRKERVLIDVVILRDVSGSINWVKDEYAKAIVILLSALENVEGVRTAQIDFNTDSKENKSFETGVEKATINPYSSGGTMIFGAYKKVLNYNFKGKRNLVIVISDGDFSDDRRIVNALEKQISAKAKILKYAIGGYNSQGYKQIKIEDIPKELAQSIIQEGLI